MTIIHATTQRVIATGAHRARGPLRRMRGLIGRARLGDGEALLLRASRIHTWGMRFAIDVVFCDRNGRVLKIYRALEPCKVTRRVPGAWQACEFEAGAAGIVSESDVLLIGDP